MKTKNNFALIPVLFGFFIMGFCDLVGISTSYIKSDFGLSETVAGFIPSMVFFWFLIFAVPTAILMNRIGRKRMTLAGNFFTLVGMVLPFVYYDFYTCMAGFIFIGIGNTVLQVSLNPLLTNVVKQGAITSSLTAGQLIKAVSSFCGPFVAAFAALYMGNWQYMFPIFGVVTLIASAWLAFTPIEEKISGASSSVAATFSLLRDRTILLLFLGIIFVVGVDVGMNTVTPKLLIERCSMGIENAGYGSSLYFLCRTAGAFVGVVLLRKMSEAAYFRANIVLSIAAMAGLYFANSQTLILVAVGIIGFGCSTIFPVLYSVAMKKMPAKANEISGLMITGVFGGAVIPPLMGYAADSVGSQIGSLAIISISMLYLAYCSIVIKTKN